MLMTAIIVSVISFFIVRFLGFGIKRLAFTFVVSFILLNLVFIRGESPYKLDKISYLDDKTYQGLADPNPYHS